MLTEDYQAALRAWATTSYVSVDSRDRSGDMPAHSYTVAFAEDFRNVIEVELVYARYKVAPGALDPGSTYVNLTIDECAPNNTVPLTSPAPSQANAFTLLPLPPISPSTSTEVEHEYDSGLYRSIKRFDAPRAKLGRLTISFTRRDGQPEAAIRDHCLRFEVRCAPVQAGVVDNDDSAVQEAIARALLKLDRRIKTLDRAMREEFTTVREASAAATAASGAETFSTGGDNKNSDDDDEGKTKGGAGEAGPRRRAFSGSSSTPLLIGAGIVAVAAGGYAAHRMGLHRRILRALPPALASL